MRDGRAIYVGAERIDDVTRHPAFRNAALVCSITSSHRCVSLLFVLACARCARVRRFRRGLRVQ